MTQDMKAVVRRFFDEVINRSNSTVADELLAPDFLDHGLPAGFPPGRSGFKQFAAMLAGAFPDLHVTVDELVAEGNVVAVRLTVRGTHNGVLLGRIAPTGTKATWTGMDFIRLDQGKMVERWSVRDLLSLMQQLGVVQA